MIFFRTFNNDLYFQVLMIFKFCKVVFFLYKRNVSILLLFQHVGPISYVWSQIKGNILLMLYTGISLKFGSAQISQILIRQKIPCLHVSQTSPEIPSTSPPRIKHFYCISRVHIEKLSIHREFWLMWAIICCFVC